MRDGSGQRDRERRRAGRQAGDLTTWQPTSQSISVKDTTLKICIRANTHDCRKPGRRTGFLIRPVRLPKSIVSGRKDPVSPACPPASQRVSLQPPPPASVALSTGLSIQSDVRCSLLANLFALRTPFVLILTSRFRKRNSASTCWSWIRIAWTSFR